MSVNLAQTNMSGWIDQPCKREDIIWSRSIGRSINDVNCATINHRVNYAVNPTGDFQQLLALANDQGFQFSPTVIEVKFTRYSQGGRWLSYTVIINPEQFGVRLDLTTPWGANSWHKMFISRDPKKVEFIERLKLWATDAQNKMDAALNKEIGAFQNLKSLMEYLGNRIPAHSINSEPDPIEEKLKILRDLFDKKILTNRQFNDQVKELLREK